ncbi:MAG: hypothetical protein A2469_00520 [Candidatus Magasanikbacteria bacterium RIFOXYC2_FULL_40_16]|uniref:Response regulatory domain-containing protein n=2 Tax=Candidatus Magasanikiibacteriota TaxID=1752731 RepID=A0A1F6NHQ0_9BACT|nr:MAG: hypothetical protein A2373_00205 [Candidatus Magasanikbacteria bacterium RIFOXYB1_FULL_40_15]OGH86486.1 MAG: hypothetical protein A2301_00910 [Candidatus Magasanikbacteria bacterium RIFOXYB2_FULL_40_13]OGH90097.1 MAG: hypothetical protein A2469_00520 [Candidatus Magasanikbacteria bacterium RIFOXYC2_FULL_40_16]
MVGKKGKILIIEDNRPIARALLLELEEKNYEVDIAYDGEEALKKMENGEADLFLLDLIMPEMDGFSLLEEIGRRGIKAGVIVVSNISSDETVERLKKFNIVDYLIKADYSLEEIAEKVDAYFDKR